MYDSYNKYNVTCREYMTVIVEIIVQTHTHTHTHVHRTDWSTWTIKPFVYLSVGVISSAISI